MKMNYRMAIQILKLTPKIKIHMVFVGVFLVFGVFYDLLLQGANAVSGIYFALPCTFMHTAFIASNLSGMIQSSTEKKKIHTLYPHLFIVPYIVLAYLCVGVYHLYLGMQTTDAVSYATNSALQGRFLVFAGIEILVALVYSAVGNKLLISGSIIFVILAMPIMGLSQSRYTTHIFALCDGHLIACFLIGFVLVLLGCVLAYWCTQALYKRDLSELALKSLARSYVK